MLPIKIRNIIKLLHSNKGINHLINMSNVYLVGGIVRDSYLNKDSKDIDIIVEGLTIDEILTILKQYSKVNIVGESFSVLKYKINSIDYKEIDIAIPRLDIKNNHGGHKGFDIKTDNVNLLEDLKRRDLTINSIAINIKTKEVIDPFNGLKDIQNKIIKATDENYFIDDPLRILRAIGFSCRFDFYIDTSTYVLMSKYASLIKEISGERILMEFEKIINKNGNIKKALIIMNETGIDKYLFGTTIDSIPLELKIPNNEIAFFSLIGEIYHIDHINFYSKILNGNSYVTKALKTIHHFYEKWSYNLPIETKKFIIFVMINDFFNIVNVDIFNNEISNIIYDMKIGLIPMLKNEIKINGNDIINIKPDIEGKQIGKLLDQMYKDALMNKYDWTDKNKCINHLKLII